MGTHLFSVSPTISCSALSSPTTSHINVVMPVSLKSSFSTFIIACFTLKGDVKSGISLFFCDLSSLS